jgi:transcriptional regulator with XRE-family HTH domain
MMKFSEWLAKEMQERRLSQRELAKRSGESHANISKVSRGIQTPTIDFCFSIARGLELEPAAVLQAAGHDIVLPQPYDETTSQVAKVMRDLSEVDKQHLLELARMLKEGRAVYVTGKKP